MRLTHLLSFALVGMATSVGWAQGERATAPIAATKVAVLHFGFDNEGEKETPPGSGILGLTLSIDTYVKAADELKAAGAEVVVVRFNSEGGWTQDPVCVDWVEKSLLPRFRVVAWVETAFGEPGLAAYAAPELYMTKDAAMGAMYWRPLGGACLIRPLPLDHWFALGERAAKSGQHPPEVVRSMQSEKPLSMNAMDGVRVFRHDLSGNTIVNPERRILMLDAHSGLVTGVSLGTVDTREELAKALKLEKVEWVGADVDQRVQERCAKARGVVGRVEKLVTEIDECAYRLKKSGTSTSERLAFERRRQVAWKEFVSLRSASREDVEGWFRMELRDIEEVEKAAKWQPEPKKGAEAPTRVAVLNVGRADSRTALHSTLNANLPVSAYAKAAEELNAAGAEVVVLKINEDDACGTEAFLDVIEREFRPRFRTVGWVSRAVNESAVVAMAMPEVCMTPDGYWGTTTCHMWDYKKCEALFARAARSGDRSRALVRSIAYGGPVSVSYTDDVLVITADESGAVVVPSQRLLNLNAALAERCGASIGTAATRDELATVLGLKRVEWVGAEVDARVQARCDEAARAFARVSELINKATLANSVLAAPVSKGVRVAEEVKRDVAWAEIVELRKEWRELAVYWPPCFISAGWVGDPDATWEMVAKSVGVTEEGPGVK